MLTSVYDPESMKLSLPELINRCKEIQLHVTKEQVDCVEKKTRGQSTNRLWFQLRLGRMTSSVMRLKSMSY